MVDMWICGYVKCTANGVGRALNCHEAIENGKKVTATTATTQIERERERARWDGSDINNER